MPNDPIRIDTLARRAILLAAGAFLIAGACFSVKWGFANTIATRTDVKEIAELGVSLSPDDPETRFSNARILEKTFDPTAISRSLTEYETAASLSPSNYLIWLSLGRARERDGDRPAAERAFYRSFVLAPNYSRVRWALGNVLVRQDKTEEGFAEIRVAAEKDPSFARSAIIAAWQAFDGDLSRMKAALGDVPATNIELAKFLAERKRFDEAAAIWAAVPPDKKQTVYRDAGKELMLKFAEAGKFRIAAKFASETAEKESERPMTGRITNGGFENGVKLKNAEYFDWQIGEGIYPQVALTDGQKKEGKFGLVVLFSAPANLKFRAIRQTIAVEPDSRYRLWSSYRSELKTSSVMRWEVVTADGKRLAATEPLLSSSDWAETGLEFSVPTEIDGVVLRLIREDCVSPTCTVSGNIWFDDFRLNAVR